MNSKFIWNNKSYDCCLPKIFGIKTMLIYYQSMNNKSQICLCTSLIMFLLSACVGSSSTISSVSTISTTSTTTSSTSVDSSTTSSVSSSSISSSSTSSISTDSTSSTSTDSTSSSTSSTSSDSSTSEYIPDYQYSYRIIYNTHGGETIADDIYVVGEDFTPKTPFKEGYTFVGWFFDEEYLLPFDILLVNSDVTIHAKYLIKEIMIYLDNAHGLENDYLLKTYGSTLTLEDFPTPTSIMKGGVECVFLYWQDDVNEIMVDDSYSVVIKDRYYAYSAIYAEPLLYGGFDISNDGKTYTAIKNTAIQIINGKNRDVGYISTEMNVTKNDYIALVANFSDGEYTESPYTSYGVSYYEYYFNTSTGGIQFRSWSGLGYTTNYIYMSYAELKALDPSASYVSKMNAFYVDKTTTSLDINLKLGFGYVDSKSYYQLYLDDVLIANVYSKNAVLADATTPLLSVPRANLVHHFDNQVGLKSHKSGNVFNNVTVGGAQ